MLKILVTLLRGKNADTTEAFTDANALPILRQQLRDCAGGVETARRSVAMVMAYAERERKSADRIAAQLADLEVRALSALTQGREDLATEAAGAIAHLEAERDTTARAIATYDTEIAHLRTALTEAETRLRDLQRGHHLAIATDHSQRLRDSAPVASTTLSEAETTLARLQARQSATEAARAATLALSASTNAEAMQNRLAAAGCGAPLRPDAASVLERLKARAA
jgi:phage shock protein A